MNWRKAWRAAVCAGRAALFSLKAARSKKTNRQAGVEGMLAIAVVVVVVIERVRLSERQKRGKEGFFFNALLIAEIMKRCRCRIDAYVSGDLGRVRFC